MSRLYPLHRAWATPALLRATLFCLPLLDELVGGIPVLTLPLARADLNFGYAQDGLLFTIAELSGLLVDPVISAASDHWSKPRLVLGAMLGLALGFALAGSSPTFSWLLLAFVVIGATNGIAVGIGPSILIDQAPEAAQPTVTRLVFLATIGDILGPLLVAGAIALHGSWRLLMGVSALVWFAVALFLHAQRFTSVHTSIPETVDDEPVWRTIFANLRNGFQTPRLMRWLLLATIPTLMDELFLGFAGLYLTDIIGVTPGMVSLALSATIMGALLSLGLMERFGQHMAPTRLLGWAALINLVGLLGFVTAQSLWPALVSLFLIGLGAAPWYPIAKGQALAALPGRSGTVRALQSVFAPFEIAAPLVIGVIAERWGIGAGVGMLIVAPMLVLLLRPRPVVTASE